MFITTVFTFIRQWGVALACTGALFWVLGASSGWYHTLQLRRHVRGLEYALAQLTAERNQLTLTIRHHTDYPNFAREQYAREYLQLGCTGEVVYRV